MKNFENKIIKEFKDEFIQDVDGFYYWFPKAEGCIGSHGLRIIANHLDKLNKEWNDQINEGLKD